MDLYLVRELENVRNKRNFNVEDYVEEKIELINKYMRYFGLKGCVIGVSGGVDSAVTLGLLKEASRKEDSPIEAIIPVMLPVSGTTGVTNQSEASSLGEKVCKAFDLKGYNIDLGNINSEIRNVVESSLGLESDDWAKGQLGPYSRTPILYYITSLLNNERLPSVVCGTINKSEGSYIGYVGKASDYMVDLQIISDIYKSEVYTIAEYLGVPDEVVNTPPRGDMFDNRIDEDVFGASYDFLELYLEYLRMDCTEKQEFIERLNQNGLKDFNKFKENIEQLHRYNSHKYNVGSPAVHLDLYNSTIPGGWDIDYVVKVRDLLNLDLK